MAIEYVDRSPSVPQEPAEQMLSIVQENNPMKPWTLVSKVAEESDEFDKESIRSDVLSPMVLEGVLTPNADGDIRTYKPEILDEIVAE